MTNNPVRQKKVAIIPFSDESYSPMISSTNKVINWIVIPIETTEKDIWVNICSQVENIIKKKKNEKRESLKYTEWKSEIKLIIGLFVYLLEDAMPPLGLEPRCSSTAS